MVLKVNDPRIIVALDFSDRTEAQTLAGSLDPARCRLKIGNELFGCAGPDLVRAVIDRGFDVFLDLKFHDIPNTVARACEAAARLGVWMVNVHAGGGSRMLRSARAAIDQSSHRPLLTAVTVLTSLATEDLEEVGITGRSVADHALGLARLSRACGLDGAVCSAQEAALLRAEFGNNFVLVTPGIRPRGSAAGDQRRITGAAEALAAGSDYLVVGRPITRAPDPLRALAEIEAEIRSPRPGYAPTPARS